MGKIHELLAVEKDRKATWNTIFEETVKKLKNDAFFKGMTRRLKMIAAGPEAEALERAAASDKAMQTTVIATFDWALDVYASMEDMQIQKNLANLVAKADVIIFPGTAKEKTVFTGLPVDQLLGLEDRLPKLKEALLAAPTLDAGVNWTWSEGRGVWASPETQTVKTDKVIDAKVLYEATDKHPAQIKEYSYDKPVGSFIETKSSGELTAVQKADALLLINALIEAVKEARMRANSAEVPKDAPKVGNIIKDLIMGTISKR